MGKSVKINFGGPTLFSLREFKKKQRTRKLILKKKTNTKSWDNLDYCPMPTMMDIKESAL